MSDERRLFGDCENRRCSATYHTARLCDCDCHKGFPDRNPPVINWAAIVARLELMDADRRLNANRVRDTTTTTVEGQKQGE